MRTNLTKSRADHIVLVGTGDAAMAALWRLCAACAHPLVRGSNRRRP